MTEPEPPTTARQWQLQSAGAWIAAATSAESARYEDMRGLARGIETLLNWAIGETEAVGVIARLHAVLACCDDLAFDSNEDSLAYICWHLLDRYGRVQQTLDALFQTGHLPIRKSSVRLLEVGAGPAPASYAVCDYYWQLAEWSRITDQPLEPSPYVAPASIDRGPAWARLVHHLSEFIADRGPARLFGTTYDDFRGFSARRLHNAGIRAAADRIQAEADRDEEYLSDQQAREFAIQSGAYPPSAYDLVVMCNFLTNPTMTTTFDAEIRELTYSLTPGGVLLILGGSGREYEPIYAAIESIIHGPNALPLKQVLSDTFTAQAAQEPRNIAASQITASLRYLRELAPQAFQAMQAELPPDVRDLEPGKVTFPRFKALAYKREGNRTIPPSDRRRIARRRSVERQPHNQ